MDKLLINDMLERRLKSAYLISFSFLGLFPIVPFIIKPFLILPLMLISIVSIFYGCYNNINWKRVWINTSIFFIFFISFFYSEDKSQAIKLLIRLSPFLVLPIGFALVPQSVYNRATENFISIFNISCCLFCVLIFVYSLFLNSSDIPYIYSHITNEFWGYEEHPIYISLYLGIALILISFEKKISYLNSFQFIIVLFTLLFLSRKGNILSLMVVLFFVLVSNVKVLFNNSFIKYVLIGILIVFSVGYFFDNYLFMRFQEVLNLSKVINSTESSTGIRSILWRVCISLSLESPFIGYGLGDVQRNINSSLIENGYKSLTIAPLNYNAHNQYLQIALSSGYLGLLAFSSILVHLFGQFINRKSKRSLSVFLYIILCFLFESLLERQNGVILIALFFNLLIFLPQEKKTTNNELSKS